VLGLMKAQMVKNSVIVPVGSKGGFIVKQPPTNDSREDLMREVVSCYQTFLRGLLDITDNYIDGRVVPPADVVRHDEDDPYLVVAADKGTATFSDIANGISDEYGFWLGDAFASGGSVGYDHKGMGITAKGAWESVKRHFREYNLNTQQQEFSVVGIGDMSGDVFGNGMLLSEHIRLVGAFNHIHIFLDPAPDAAATFAERQRLFAMGRSSWEDYNQSLISCGGGVFSRAAKSIEISPQVAELFNIKEKSLAPNELINRLLKARVDLLWNGGIGTYIKASSENHADAQDKTNDALRVNANELRCRVVGEGGNLGCTQLGRIEFALRGGKIYTDAIDNSAGVDCSDHEVNIKILVDGLVRSGDLAIEKRSALLAEMTDEVSDLVLRDNYLQTQCISLAVDESARQLDEHARFMLALESDGKLNRAIEYLPDHEAIAERAANERGLSAPELAVLVAYSKMDIYEELRDSDLVKESFFNDELVQYFPRVLGRKFSKQITQHQLRSEIIATQITNSLVNRLGPTYLYRLKDELGATTIDVAMAYVAVRTLFRMRDLWFSIESLDNEITSKTQHELLRIVRGWVERGVHWMVKNRRVDQRIQSIIDYFEQGADDLRNEVPQVLAKPNKASYRSRCKHFVKHGVPDAVAHSVSSVVPLSSSFDIIDIGATSGVALNTTAAVYFQLGDFLDIQWLREQIGQLDASNHWHGLANSALRSDLHYQQRHLCAEILSGKYGTGNARALVKQWAQQNAPRLDIYSQRLSDIKSNSSVDYAMLSLAVTEVHKLLQSARPLGGAN
ncbi:MAG: NAD-glutamate dehydrogenase domain-containing protein, partial [Pseudomonadota bacterium]